MTTEEVQQVLGLLINAGLAMSTLAIFFVVRYLFHKNRKKASLETRVKKEMDRL